MTSRIFLVALLATASSCASKIPRAEVRFWAGDSRAQAVTRRQANQTLACSDPGFDLGFWMTYADFREFVKTYVLTCKEWDDSAPMISREDWQKMLDSFLGGSK